MFRLCSRDTTVVLTMTLQGFLVLTLSALWSSRVTTLDFALLCVLLLCFPCDLDTPLQYSGQISRAAWNHEERKASWPLQS